MAREAVAAAVTRRTIGAATIYTAHVGFSVAILDEADLRVAAAAAAAERSDREPRSTTEP